MNKYDLSKVSREALEAYASDALGVKGGNPSTAYKSGERVLAEAQGRWRTRAEVDAEIVEVIRTYDAYIGSPYVDFSGHFAWKGQESVSVAKLVRELVKEETDG